MNKIFKPLNAWLILGLCTLFVLLRIPSLVEPNWYADEGIYQVVGRAINDGRTLYQQVWDNKPPLLYIIYAVASGNLYLVKLLSLLSGLVSVGVFFLLTDKLFKRLKSRFISTFVYVLLFGSPLLEGNIANAENFMLLPIVLSAFFTLSYVQSKKPIYLVVSGLLLSIAFVTKIVAVFDFSAFLIFLFLTERNSRKKINFKPYFYFIFSFMSALLLFVVYFFLIGALNDFIGAVFLQNVSYVGEENKFILPMGVLVFKTIALFILVIALSYNAKKLSTTTLFLYLWIVFGVYNAFFSERPYTHYLLVILPAFALLVAHFLEYRRKRLLDVCGMIAIILLAFFHFQIYVNTLYYYENFISFITNTKNIVDYETFFDKNAPRDYSIASFIDMNTTGRETVFLWSDSPQIYVLSNKLPIGKYIVAYHIKFYKNADIITKKQIEQVWPKYIIQTVEGLSLSDIASFYRLRYITEGIKIYEREI